MRRFDLKFAFAAAVAVCCSCVFTLTPSMNACAYGSDDNDSEIVVENDSWILDDQLEGLDVEFDAVDELVDEEETDEEAIDMDDFFSDESAAVDVEEFEDSAELDVVNVAETFKQDAVELEDEEVVEFQFEEPVLNVVEETADEPADVVIEEVSEEAVEDVVEEVVEDSDSLDVDFDLVEAFGEAETVELETETSNSEYESVDDSVELDSLFEEEAADEVELDDELVGFEVVEDKVEDAVELDEVFEDAENVENELEELAELDAAFEEMEANEEALEEEYEEVVELDAIFDEVADVEEAVEEEIEEVEEAIDDLSDLIDVDEEPIAEEETEDVAAAIEEAVVEEVAEELVDEVIEEQDDEIVDEVAEEADVEELVEEVVEEQADEVVDELVEEAAVEELVDEVIEEQAEEVVEEQVEEVAETVVEESSDVVETADVAEVEVQESNEVSSIEDLGRAVSGNPEPPLAESEWVAEEKVEIENGDVSEVSYLEDQYWIVMANGNDFFCQVLDGNVWRQVPASEFFASDNAQRSTIVWVHGFQTDMSGAAQSGYVLRNVVANARAASGSDRAFRLVVWKWNSERNTMAIRYDAMQKERLADIEGVALGRFVGMIDGSNNVSFIGFSFGARVTGSALQTLATCQSKYMSNKTGKISLVLASAACDAWAFDNGVYAKGARIPSYVLNVYNPADRALRFYPAVSETRSTAQGVMPISGNAFVSAQGSTFNLNVSGSLGNEHSFQREIQSIPCNVIFNALF